MRTLVITHLADSDPPASEAVRLADNGRSKPAVGPRGDSL